MTAAAASRLLAEGLTVRNGRTCVSDRTYYDSFDGLLHAAGLVAVWEQGELALRDPGDRTRARAVVAKPTKPLFAWDLEAGGLGDALKALIDARALLPLVSRTLATKLGFEAAAQSLLDEAVSLAGGRPGGRPAKVEVAISGRQRADEATAAVLRALLEVITDNLDGTIADLDSEFLHDLRVAVRRSRAVQRELRGVFPPEPLARSRREFRWLQQVTGEVRDLDVYVLEFDAMRAMVPAQNRPQLSPLLAVLQARRKRARRRMVRALRSDRTATLLADWGALLARLPETPPEGRPDAERPIATLAGERIAKVYTRMVKMGQAIDPASPSDEYHELRKQGKELRYLLELFGTPLYPADVVRPLIRSLKALQDVLGRHQDREIQVETLRSLGTEVSAAHDGAAALMAMGMLVQRLQADQQAARGAFSERFASFASKAQRKLVKETFG
jgi:CHAD domain-containing protein